ncbi:hypothetical protein A1359_16060 [Methylomonas lenta]|uniref:DUF6794 domain-containing protein n=1 Tax=Methylomonas lenta TaxID=980561 RepID=A0A177MYI9_9GAMM|nr:DUF6794 domain-containing protein [Methylomonas lenta]OAI10766.1 hypothetical protein A1359_16060 [Methylomonas lenta]
MAKNWSDLKLELSQPPCSIDQAVERLLLVLNDKNKLVIAALPAENLCDLYHTIGMAIKNAWLHKPDNQLLASCGTSQPDDASSVIISELWQALQP